MQNGPIASDATRTDRDSFANEAASSVHPLTTTWRYACEEPTKEQFARWRRIDLYGLGNYTYFARAEDGLIKIGRSIRPGNRMRELELEIYQRVTLLATVRDDFELCYHNEFAAYRVIGEWFAPHPSILEEIDRILLAKGGEIETGCRVVAPR